MPETSETLTPDDIDSLNQVGVMMCDDMINACAAADLMAAMGIESRVTREVTQTWVAIADEYAEALDALEAGTI